MQKAVVINPTYNEKGNIEKLITTLEEEIFPQVKNWEMYILVADDNSPDGTGDEVRKLMEKYKNLDIVQGEKNGLGAAYVRGMTYAIEKMGADVVFEMDADLQHDPTKIPDFLKKIDDGADMVLGNRYSDGGSIPQNWPIQRKMFSIVANLFVRLVFFAPKIHDWTGGYRALKKEVFLKEKEKLSNFKGYIFQISFLHKALRDGFVIGEVPFHFGDRTLGKSKIAPLSYIMSVLYFVISTRIKELLFGSFGKFLVVGGIGFILQLLVYRFLIKTTPLPLGIASWMAAQLAIFSNFNLNNLWTFRHEKTRSVFSYFKRMLGFFASSNIGVLIIQSGLVQLGETLFGRNFPLPYVYFVFATGLLLIYNFTMYRFVIWRKKPHKS